jgi:ATP-dependent Lon protease
VLQIALQYMPEPLQEGVEEMVAKDDNQATDTKKRISTH